jgi:hypothetical protein
MTENYKESFADDPVARAVKVDSRELGVSLSSVDRCPREDLLALMLAIRRLLQKRRRLGEEKAATG